MKFKRKHASGPFKISEDDACCVNDVYGFLVCECYSSPIGFPGQDSHNTKLFKEAPAMVDYLIERAECLAKDTQFNDSAFDDGWKRKRKELLRLVEILKAAGVEVKE